jgi:PAS domain S-box-containing protein
MTTKEGKSHKRRDRGGSEESKGVLDRVVEELRIHQVELEQQNEELRRTQIELDEARRKYFDLFNSAPVGHLSLDEQGQITEANLTAAELLGLDRRRLVGRRFAAFLAPGSRDLLRATLVQLREEPGRRSCELELENRGGSRCTAIVVLTAQEDDPGQVSAALVDISEQKGAEEMVRVLVRELVTAQEEERARISCELHDRVAQDLSALDLGLASIADIWPEVPEGLLERVEELRESVKTSIRDLRDLSSDLAIPAFAEEGLGASMAAYCELLERESELKVTFGASGVGLDSAPFEVASALYRLMQEALKNAVRHAGASQVSVRLVAAHPNLILRIEDDGKGFDVEQRAREAEHDKRMGLRTMRERVRLLGGRFEVHSEVGRGTRLAARVPIGGSGR